MQSFLDIDFRNNLRETLRMVLVLIRQHKYTGQIIKSLHNGEDVA